MKSPWDTTQTSGGGFVSTRCYSSDATTTHEARLLPSGLAGNVLSSLVLSPLTCCGAQAGPQLPFLHLGGVTTTS